MSALAAVRGYRRVLVQALLFLGFLAAFLLLNYGTAVGQSANRWMNRAVAATCSALLRSLGFDSVSEGIVIHSQSYAVHIVDECNGLLAMGLLISACLSLPVRWRSRCLGVVGAVAFVFAFNQLRLASILWIGNNWPGFVQTYESVIVRAVHWLLAIVFAMAWAKKALSKEKGSV